MEALTLGERETSTRSSYTHATVSRPRSPRLPTPDASRCSNEAVDTIGGCNGYEKGASLPGMLLRINSERSINDVGSYHRGSRNSSAPHSPPYRASDTPKPSLPPLKTVLADNMSSPPQTPTALSAPFQPSPREPAYTTSTYKPPSLYPNKKPRTDSFITASGPYSAPSSIGTMGMSSASYDSRSRNGPGRPNDPIFQQHASRRYSVQPPHSEQGGARSSNVSYRTPEQTPTSTTFERRIASQQGGSMPWEHPGHRPDRLADRRSGDPYCPYDRTQYGSAHSRLPSAQHFARAHQSQRDYFDQLRENQPLDRPNAPYLSPYARGPHYDNGHAPYFMPSHYDYQHGKARKRSNLPKQSTEIMKTWFDQNISNPYPSEEQKALFSNATGISMTQVSNWFINHRRRCPELRDKRDRNRGNGRDIDM